MTGGAIASEAVPPPRVAPTVRAVATLPEVVVPAVAGVLIGLVAWPAFTLVVLAVAAIVALAQWRPDVALVAAIGLFGLEGTVKILFINGGLPVGATGQAVGAALLDLALFGVALTILLRSPRVDAGAAWRGLTRGERIVVGAAVAWLVLSILQVPLSPSLTDAIEGVRLTHAYVLVAVAAAVVFLRAADRDALVTGLLGVLFVLMAYAAVRGIVGPDPAERAYALARGGVVSYGPALRALGTFSSGIALGTVAAPAAAFAVALAVYSARHRRPALAVAAVAIVAELATYGRTPVVATVVAVGFVAVFGVLAGASGRRRTTIALAFAGCFLVLAGGTVVAAQGSPTLRERLEGLVQPSEDESLQKRWDNWGDRIDQVRADPLGTGIGTAGGASRDEQGLAVTTDSSYLQVLVSQGVPGGLLFAVAVFGAIAVVTRRLGAAPPGTRALGVAALAGFVAFALLMITNETVEQPGKVLAWALLGVAIACAWSPRRERPATPGAGRAWVERVRAAVAGQDPRERLRWLAASAALLAFVLTITLLRTASFTLDVPVFGRATPPLAKPPREPTYIERLASDPGVWFAVERAEGLFGLPHLREQVSIEPARPRGLEAALVVARSPTQQRGARLLEAVARYLEAASVFELRNAVEARMTKIRAALPRKLTKRTRRRLNGELAALRRVAAEGPKRIVFAPRPRKEHPLNREQLNTLDRLAEDLPGPTPPRPDPLPLALVLAGLLAAAWLAALAWRRQ